MRFHCRSPSNPHKGKLILCAFNYWVFDRVIMQRLTNWSSDIWHGTLLCSTLGVFSVTKSNHENIAVVQSDTEVSFSSSNVQPLSVESFFEEDRVDHMYRFDGVQHEVACDFSAIEDISAFEDCDHDVSLVKLGVDSVVTLRCES